MGCSGSKKQGNPTVEAARRRLSVGQVDPSAADGGDANVAEEDRGMLKNLNEKSLFEMLNADTGAGGRKFSLGSKDDAGKTSFANKATEEQGDKVKDPTGLGYTCRKGLKPESPNQDSWTIIQIDGDFAIYGVFDGHGKQGHHVSGFVKDNLPKLIIKDQRFAEDGRPNLGAVCSDAFKKVQNLVVTADQMKKFEAQLSGTTCTICIHNYQNNKLTWAHVADSTGMIAKWNDSSKKAVTAKQMTRDHKPDLKDERARIEKNNGRVVFDGYANHRVYAKNGRYPGLNMSRCLGDILGHTDCGISCEPEIAEITVDPMDAFILLCSDGVWEFMNVQEASDLVAPMGAGKAVQAAEKLAKEAWDRWIKEEGGAVVDDITVVLSYLNLNNRDNAN